MFDVNDDWHTAYNGDAHRILVSFRRIFAGSMSKNKRWTVCDRLHVMLVELKHNISTTTAITTTTSMLLTLYNMLCSIQRPISIL